MRIIHLTYGVARPRFTDPDVWLKRIDFATGVLEHISAYAEITGIYHIDFKGSLLRNGVNYIFPGFSRLALLLPFRFNWLVRSLQPDAIVVHGLIFPWQVIMLHWVCPKARIICQHHAERPLRDIRQFIHRYADKFIHAYLFSSFEQGDEWIKRKQIASRSKIRIVMGTSSVFHHESRTIARLRTGLKTGPVFLWIGNLDPNKDPLLITRAFIQFSKVNRDAILVMIYQNRMLEEDLRMAVGESSNIKLIGPVIHEKLQDWFNSADFIVSTSHYEGSGIAVCEALSCGCIPIVSNIPSLRMMTDSGRLGLLFTPGSQAELEHALHTSLELNVDNLSVQVREFFDRELSFAANAKKIMDIVNE